LRRAGAPRAEQPARHEGDGPRGARRRDPRDRRAGLDRMERVTRLHPDAGCRRRVALRSRQDRDDGVHRLMRRGAQIAAVVVVLGLLGLLVYKVVHNPKGLATKVDKQEIVPAYPFSPPPVGLGGPVSLPAPPGKAGGLNFWQSYCPPCTREAPVVSQAAKRWAGKDVVFVGVDEQDLSGPATKFMKRFDITYPVISDDGPLIGHYGVTGYPETFFIDKHGRVIPLPPNTSGQVGHIIGPATPQLLDLGIRTAMEAKRPTPVQ